MEEYRKLEIEEIRILETNFSIAENWDLVSVKNGFDPSRIYNTSFSGEIFLGNFNSEIILPGGVKKRSGIRNASLHNVKVGDNVYINNVHNYIANYSIGKNSFIENIGSLFVEGFSSFGDGIKISVLTESGGQEVIIHSKLSSHLAYMESLYRYHAKFIKKIEEIAYTGNQLCISGMGEIGANVFIQNVGEIKNVKIGDSAKIMGASRLENGQVNSNEFAPIFIGNNVVSSDFIISSGSKIDNGAIIERCFIGQACVLTNGYTVNDSLIFCNSYCGNGEACAIFAGPYTVSHHKSTLLIAGMFSFMNAGSGSNQSNHMYKLGPIHHGILERGSKTASDSYILYPSHIGPFSLIMGKHMSNVDTKDLPFSYLLESEETTFIVPGANFRSVGTSRDAEKWPKRDKRTDPEKFDFINFELLTPYVAQKMINGITILNNLLVSHGDIDVYPYQNAKIKKTSLKKGLELYRKGVNKFLGKLLLRRLVESNFNSVEDVRQSLKPATKIGLGSWVDLSGLIAPKTEIEKLILSVEQGKISSYGEIQEYFLLLDENYSQYEWVWAHNMLEKHFNVDLGQASMEDLIHIIKKCGDSEIDLDKEICSDALKEFSKINRVGFGVDGCDYQIEKDFNQIRGGFDSNTFVKNILDNIDEKISQNEEIITKLNKIINTKDE